MYCIMLSQAIRHDLDIVFHATVTLHTPCTLRILHPSAVHLSEHLVRSAALQAICCTKDSSFCKHQNVCMDTKSSSKRECFKTTVLRPFFFKKTKGLRVEHG